MKACPGSRNRLTTFCRRLATMTDLAGKTAENLTLVRKNRPLVHNITNFVVMQFTANVLLACGASPVMAHAANEVEEMVDLADSLVLNIGTLTDDWVLTMIKAGRRANDLGKPIILDPVGAGATGLRTNSARALLAQTWVSVVRGNVSEILALTGGEYTTRGVDVDTGHCLDQVNEPARKLARELGTTLAITGVRDLVTDGHRTLLIEGGHPLMPFVTGSGCAATALIGAFHAVDKDPLSAAATALAFYGVAGESAGNRAEGPGTFALHLLDALYTLQPDEVEARSRITRG